MSIPEHPARSPQVERILESRFVSWRFDPAIPIDRFDVEASLKNQARILVDVDKSTSEAYAAAKEAGDIFPAGVSYPSGRRLIYIDGNQRHDADLMLGQPTIPGYIVEATREVINLLTFELNTLNGLPASDQDRLAHAFNLLGLGHSVPEAAAVVRLPVKRVTAAWQQERADARGRELNIPGWNKLAAHTRTRINTIKSDSAVRALAELARTAKMSLVDVSPIVTAMNAVGPDDQLAIVTREREARRENIGNTPKRRTASNCSILRSHLTYCIKLDERKILDEQPTDVERNQLTENLYAAADHLMRLAEKL